ncbi:MAG: hypothetical protein KatS3mg031_2002 [Chitinophagales bacterium]|nr:MAG: hypothetical protein KatS3mg031_2002 [Chitinophagales bacterium]
MDQPIVIVEGLSKVYRITGKQSGSIFSEKLTEVKAVHDVSFELKEGEICGLIGKNGAGKTTLLEMLSGIVKPSAGRITFKGKVASVIDIGTGMHQDLTGIENIYLAGNLLGYSNKEIKERLPDIIAFSELGDFIKRPVKYYSSGMFIRLAFSTLTHLEADILLIDEIIGVGDIAFSEKALKRIMDICRKGKTALIASHSISFITSSCNTAMYMHQGKLIDKGPVSEIIEQYVEQILQETSFSPGIISPPQSSSASALQPRVKDIRHSKNYQNPDQAFNNGIRLIKAEISSPDSQEEEFTMENTLILYLETEIDLEEEVIMSVHFNYNYNQPGLCLSPLYSKQPFVPLKGKGHYRFQTTIPSGIMNAGLYTISVFFASLQHELLSQYKNIIVFKIRLPHAMEANNYYEGGFAGPVFLKTHWQMTSC